MIDPRLIEAEAMQPQDHETPPAWLPIVMGLSLAFWAVVFVGLAQLWGWL